eukprot:2167245-Alexandrium_andersonii.AAC.1
MPRGLRRSRLRKPAIRRSSRWHGAGARRCWGARAPAFSAEAAFFAEDRGCAWEAQSSRALGRK